MRNGSRLIWLAFGVAIGVTLAAAPFQARGAPKMALKSAVSTPPFNPDDIVWVEK